MIKLCPHEMRKGHQVWILFSGSYWAAAQKRQMKCLGSLQLSALIGFEDVKNHHKWVGRQTSKRRSQSFCLSVFLPPASLSRPHLCASLTHARQSFLCAATIFICNQRKLSPVELIVSFYSCLCEDPALLSFDIYTGLWMKPVKTNPWVCCSNCTPAVWNKTWQNQATVDKYGRKNKHRSLLL